MWPVDCMFETPVLDLFFPTDVSVVSITVVTGMGGVFHFFLYVCCLCCILYGTPLCVCVCVRAREREGWGRGCISTGMGCPEVESKFGCWVQLSWY
jgi:hypothetical protein